MQAMSHRVRRNRQAAGSLRLTFEHVNSAVRNESPQLQPGTGLVSQVLHARWNMGGWAAGDQGSLEAVLLYDANWKIVVASRPGLPRFHHPRCNRCCCVRRGQYVAAGLRSHQYSLQCLQSVHLIQTSDWDCNGDNIQGTFLPTPPPPPLTGPGQRVAGTRTGFIRMSG